MLAWSAVLMSWSVESTLTDQFTVVREHLSELFASRRRVGRTYQGYSAALLRLSPRLLRWIEVHLRDLTWRLIGRRDDAGRHVFTVDGTKIDLPRTPEHEHCFGVAGKSKCRPQALLTCVLHLTSGMLWSYRIGPARASERGHLRSMLSLLPLNALLVADAGFVGYELLAAIIDLFFHMTRHQMSTGLLAQYVGLFRWRVRRHLTPKGYARMSPAHRRRYADLFEISVDDLDRLPESVRLTPRY